MRTAYAAGSSVEMIQRHYLNMNVPKDEVKRFFELTHTKARRLVLLIKKNNVAFEKNQ